MGLAGPAKLACAVALCVIAATGPGAAHGWRGVTLAQMECGKTGYGVALCPDYGKPSARRPVAPAQPKPLDDCLKTGWGTPMCPNFGKKAPEESAEMPAPRYQEPLDDCMKTGWGTPMCPNYGRKPAPK